MHLTELNLSLTQDVVHAIQKKLVALSTPHIQSGKDNTTEGMKKTQEKVLAATEGKGKDILIEGESSFSHLLKEGEIDEPYVPEYVDGVFTNEEAQVHEEDEFAGEYAFHDDCLLNGVEEIITFDFQEA